ncbi:MAG: HAD family hydrolase [Bacteroidota bacterium]
MKPFAIIFDMDGVIVDSNPAHKIALQQFCAQHGHQLTDDQLRNKIYGRTNKEWIVNLFGQLPEEQIRAFAEEKEAMYREIFKDDIKPVTGLIPFLDLLDQHRIPRAIGTSAPQSNVVFTLAKTNTEKYFSTILNDTFVTHSKPHPEIYLKCAQTLGLPNSQCIVIEDSLSGVEAGKAAGSKVIGITTTHTREELSHTDLVIDDFRNLTIEQLAQLVA